MNKDEKKTVFSGGAGSTVGSAGAVTGVILGGSTTTLSASGITSGLAAVGSIASGGMLAGLCVVAVAPIAGMFRRGGHRGLCALSPEFSPRRGRHRHCPAGAHPRGRCSADRGADLRATGRQAGAAAGSGIRRAPAGHPPRAVGQGAPRRARSRRFRRRGLAFWRLTC